MSIEGIQSTNSLAKELSFLTQQQASLFRDPQRKLDIIMIDEEMGARPLCGISDAGEQRFVMKSRTMHIKQTSKRSTIMIVDE
ncbi:MAG: hypothetical protein EZS28_013127 [Streblomastix strix]|uniref:Uncharacterized protein n=1 Tax=Streblomastix strix TaxID=222440 RepID=A0A5J4W9K9_9EUKA|nr:MAG: hypothetical protein EZS28_013127 [Streblomastix strix]